MLMEADCICRYGPRYGNKAWIFRYSLDRRARAMGLGALHTVLWRKPDRKQLTAAFFYKTE